MAALTRIAQPDSAVDPGVLANPSLLVRHANPTSPEDEKPIFFVPTDQLGTAAVDLDSTAPANLDGLLADPRSFQLSEDGKKVEPLPSSGTASRRDGSRGSRREHGLSRCTTGSATPTA